jgi:uncharacterized protein DUF2017
VGDGDEGRLVSRVSRSAEADQAGAPLVEVELSVEERMLLADLTEQLVDVLGDGSDPVMGRLLPTAYPDDAEAAAEFRRFTAEGLAERKAENARTMHALVGDNPEGGQEPEDRRILLSAPGAEQWLRTLTDLRLTIANRLGIEHDDEEGRTDEAALPLQYAYYWLGQLQESLVQVLQG